jgi:hypothetical protein
VELDIVLAEARGERALDERGSDFAVRGLSVDEALIDGEAVVFRADGKSDFNALLIKRGGAQDLARGLRPSTSRRRRSPPVAHRGAASGAHEAGRRRPGEFSCE